MNRWPSPTPVALVGTAVIVAGLVFGLYLLTMPIVQPASGDAMAQTAATLREPIDLDPHHLLVTPVDRLAVGLARGLGYHGPAFLPIQGLNSLAGATACGLFLFWIARIGTPLTVAVPFTLALACTFAHWFHSREAETGILANLFLLATLNLLPFAHGRRTSVFVPAFPAILTILAALNCAALMPALGLMDAVEPERRVRRRLVVSFLAATAVGTIVAFIVVPWIVGERRPGAMIAEIVTHPSSARLAEHGQVSFSNFLRAASGLANAFTGDNAVTTALKERLQGKEPVPLTSTDWVRFVLGAAIALSLVLVLLDPPRTPRERILWLATWAALVPTAIFNLLWLGSDPQFWLPILPFLFAWSALWFSRDGRHHRAGPRAAAILVPAAATIALAVLNAASPVPTLSRRAGGLDWQQARAFAEQSQPGDLLLHNGGFGPYLQAMGRTGAVSLVYTLPSGRGTYAQALLAGIDRTLDQGHRVFALNVFGPPTAATTGGWEEIRAISGQGRDEWLKDLKTRYDVRPVEPPTLGDLWEIRARTATAEPAPSSEVRP
jgi:hypothetical protein